MTAPALEHRPVLYRETVELLSFSGRPVRIIDGTLGNGGHSALLLRANPALEVLGIDRDGDALERAAEHLAFAGSRVRLERGNFSDLARIAAAAGWERVDGILLDIGVSSPQLDDAERGFSWRMPGPLDMRMDRRSEMTASRLLNRADEADLERIFREYGEVRQARRLARTVVAEREAHPLTTTAELAELCDRALGRARRGELPSPTLVFQALRIAVNDELGELERALAAAVGCLKPGGRLAVISFHSLEDRMVKHFFRRAAASCVCPPGLPVCICGKRQTLRLLTPRALTAQPDELAENRRSACAKLRAAERTEEEMTETNRDGKRNFR